MLSTIFNVSQNSSFTTPTFTFNFSIIFSNGVVWYFCIRKPYKAFNVDIISSTPDNFIDIVCLHLNSSFWGSYLKPLGTKMLEKLKGRRQVKEGISEWGWILITSQAYRSSIALIYVSPNIAIIELSGVKSLRVTSTQN